MKILLRINSIQSSYNSFRKLGCLKETSFINSIGYYKWTDRDTEFFGVLKDYLEEQYIKEKETQK